MREGWKYDKLGRICETSSGGTPSKSIKEYYDGGNIPWLRSGEISQGLIYNTELYITEEGLKNSSAKLFPIDTVVIAMYGATVGQVGVLKKTMATNQAVCGIFPSPLLRPHFLVYYLKAKKSYFLNLAAGGAQSNISQNIIKDTLIPILPLPEQQKIVEELDCLSKMIELKKKQLETYDKLAQSIFYDMFGDPINNEKGWEVKKLGDICNSELGKMLDAKKARGNFHPYLCALNVQWGEFNMDIVKEMKIEEDEIERYSVRKGDLLICEGGDTGRSAIWNSDNVIFYQNSLHRVRLYEDKLLPIVCLYIMQSLKKSGEIDKYSTGQTIKHLVKKSLLTIPMIAPPLPLQQQFAEKIEAIEKQKELIKQTLKGLEELFNSRMDYYFN